MADYAFTGKKGTGKSKNVVRMAFSRYLSRGRRVATNLDLFLEPAFGPFSKVTYVRLPDKPSAFDLEAAGHGNPNDRYNEDMQGFMPLDELGTWMNSRSFNDKSRAGVLDFLAHGRKRGWDVGYIMQDVRQIDAQVRDSFIEFTWRHIRMDKVKWPFVGGLLATLFGEKAGYMPRFHLAIARLGHNPQDIVTDRVWGTWREYEKCYDTLQEFRADYPHGTHSVLSPWHVKGRYLRAQRPPFWSVLLRALLPFGGGKAAAVARPRPVTRPDAGWDRVRGLCAKLPATEAAAYMARYARVRLTSGDAGPALAGPAAAEGGR